MNTNMNTNYCKSKHMYVLSMPIDKTIVSNKNCIVKITHPTQYIIQTCLNCVTTQQTCV